MNIVIIEDEMLTAKDLQRTLVNIDNTINILHIIQSVEEGIDFFVNNNVQVDLIFSDIQLGDGLSFDIFSAIQNSTPIIFCTAFNNYATQAFAAFGIDYLLKPFSKESVTKALTKFSDSQMQKQLSITPEYSHILQALKTQLQPRVTSIVVKQGEKIIPLDVQDIALFYFENGYSFAYTFAQKTFILSKTLEEVELQCGVQFFRANRQHLINRKAVKEATQHFNRKLQVFLTVPFPEEIIIGKLKITAFTNWLAGL